MDTAATPVNLTKLEIPQLPEEINLTDGHTYRSWTPDEKAIIARTPELMMLSDRRRQREIEAEYAECFYSLTAQSGTHGEVKRMICSSASMSLEIVANVLRLRGRDKIRLLEPTFDNLAEIYRRHKLRVEPITEKECDEASFTKCLPSGTGACCIVSPNNPTGWTISELAFRSLCEHCHCHGIVLILDACFRAYCPVEQNYDQYLILVESGVEFVVIEDTGKTWPTLELKISILACSEDIYHELFDVYTDFILHVSPFALILLTEFIKLSLKDKGDSIRALVATNRQILTEAFPKKMLIPDGSSGGSVLWAKSIGCTSDELVRKLAKQKVHVLPGAYFFWKNWRRGSHHIRISLTRDVSVVQKAAEVFRVLEEVKR
jgi:aspartate/methionine/tyrosine aminotransferase